MKKTILVTGASSGIGLAIATKLSAEQHLVFGAARDPERGKSPPFNPIRIDVTQDESVGAGIQQVLSTANKIDVLINCAGNGIAGPAYAVPDPLAKRQFEVNFFGMVRMCTGVIPHMLKSKSGLIINISSLGGLFGLPYQGLYSASKFAMEGYSESLRMELLKTGIRVVVVNPGDFKTAFGSNREKMSFSLPDGPLRKNYEDAMAVIERDENAAPGPEQVAAKIAGIVGRANPSHRYLVGQASQTIVPLLKRVLPGGVFQTLLSSHYGIK